MKEFIGNDNIILKKQEHVLSVFMRFFKGICVFLILIWMLGYIIYLNFSSLIIPVLTFIVAVILCFLYLRIFYKDTFILVTNTKILKSVRNGLFSSHVIELPLSRVRQIRANNNGIMAKIFWYWDIEIQGFEESSNMYFKSMSGNKNAMSVISTAMEKLQEN